MPVLEPLLSFLDDADPLKRRMAERGVSAFEELTRGYHTYHYRDKIRCYHAARDAMCSVAALAALTGDDALSKRIQEEPLHALASLIRSMEKKGKKTSNGK